MTETEKEVLAVIYSHELSDVKRRIRKKYKKRFEELYEQLSKEYKEKKRGLARYVRGIPAEVKLRLREMGHYDLIPLGKIMRRGEEGQRNGHVDEESLAAMEKVKI